MRRHRDGVGDGTIMRFAADFRNVEIMTRRIVVSMPRVFCRTLINRQASHAEGGIEYNYRGASAAASACWTGALNAEALASAILDVPCGALEACRPLLIMQIRAQDFGKIDDVSFARVNSASSACWQRHRESAIDIASKCARHRWLKQTI